VPPGIAICLNINAHISHQKKKRENHRKLSFFFLCSQTQKDASLAESPSFIYVQLLILP
jgi:hypothetical protein